MNQQQALLKAKKVFANHKVDTLFVTSDMQAFFELAAASDHANSTVGDKEVFTATRDQAEAAEETTEPNLEEPNAEQKLQAAKDKVELLKSNLVAKQEEFDKETDETKLDELEQATTKLGEDLEAAEKDLAALEAE